MTAGECWAGDTLPAVIETVIDQRAAKGVTAWRTETRQRILQDRRRVWFRVPCPDAVPPERLASLQRA